MRYLATSLIYVAVIARAIGWNFETAPIPTGIWILLGVFGAILFSQRALTRRFPLYPRLYTLVQSGLVIAMLYRAPTLDFLPMLFYSLSFQAVQFFHARIGFAWIGVFSLAMAGMFLLRPGMAGGADHAAGFRFGEYADGQLRAYDSPHRAEAAGEPAACLGSCKRRTAN